MSHLICYLEGEIAPKIFISFKGPLVFYKNIKGGYITLEKGQQNQNKFKSDLNEIVTGKLEYNTEEQKGVIRKY